MKNYTLTLFTLFVLLLFLPGCDEVFEEDISGDEVFIIAPVDGSVLRADTTVVFGWELLQGATSYQFRLVSPDFSNAVLLLADTVLNGSRYQSNGLPAGNYQWAISGLNNGYATDFFISSFTVIPAEGTDDLSGVRVRLTEPAGALTTTGSVNFSWEEINGASAYRMQLAQPDFSETGQILRDTVLTSNTVSFTLEAGSYTWRVKGIGQSTETLYSEQTFTLTVEEEPAPVINAVSPAAGSSLNNISVIFSWDPLAEAANYTFTLDGPVTEEVITADTAVSVLLNGNSGEYQWYVRAADAGSDTIAFTYISGPAEAPDLLSPAENSTLNPPFEFRWQRKLNSISADSLYLFNQSDELVTGFPRFTEEEKFRIDQLPAGIYSWNVRSVDQDGRTGPAGQTRTFTVSQ